MRKTCPHCRRRVGRGAARCRGCGYPFPEGGGPKPAGLALGVGFPLFLMGCLILISNELSRGLVIAGIAMVVLGIGLFFDPR